MQENIFSLRLREKMKEHSLRQIDILNAAREQGIKLGKSHISQYVSGKTIPRDNIITFLSEILDTEPEWLKGTESSGKDTHSFGENNTGGNNTMREFKKSSKLDNVLYDVRGPVVEEAARMEAAGTQVLKLNIGNPAPFGFRTPDEVIYDMKAQLTECEGYSASKGLFSARKAIMQYYQNRNVEGVTIEDIYTGNGVSDRFIAITILAGGTSLPELATCIVAAARHKDQLALGNILGSNVFNILLILGCSSVITPLSFQGMSLVDAGVLIASCVMLLLWAYSGRKCRIDRWEGALMLLFIAAYYYYLFVKP